MVMAIPLTFRQMMMRAALPAGCMLVGGYFAFHAVDGPTGYNAWRDYRVQHAKLDAAVASSKEQKVALQRQLALLNPRAVNPDLADELVRRNLDLIRPDEVVVPLPAEPGPVPQAGPDIGANAAR
jgi:cell division protein FtsB